MTAPSLRPALRRALEFDPVDTLSAACLLLITRGRGMDLVVERLGVTEGLKAQRVTAEYARAWDLAAQAGIWKAGAASPSASSWLW